MRLKIEIVADDALGIYEEIKKTAELALKGDENAFQSVAEEAWKKQLLEAGLKLISIKVAVVEGAKP